MAKKDKKQKKDKKHKAEQREKKPVLTMQQREDLAHDLGREPTPEEEKHRYYAIIRLTDNAFIMFDKDGKLKTPMSKKRAKRLKERMENKEFDHGTFDGVPPTDLDWGV